MNIVKDYTGVRFPGGHLMLSIGRTSSYAISALSRLAQRDASWVLLSDIASGIDAPEPYLSKILHLLSKAGIVRTKRGYKGGYSLARPAARISLLDIIEAIEGSEAICECLLGRAECSDERACPAHEFWQTERERVRDRLSNMTLDAVAAFERRQAAGKSTKTRSKKTAKAKRKATSSKGAIRQGGKSKKVTRRSAKKQRTGSL